MINAKIIISLFLASLKGKLTFISLETYEYGLSKEKATYLLRNDRKQCDKTTTEGTRHLSCLIPDNAAMGLSTLRKKGHYEYAFRPSYFQYYVHNIHNNYPALQVLINVGR